jgi:hypothetical protein
VATLIGGIAVRVVWWHENMPRVAEPLASYRLEWSEHRWHETAATESEQLLLIDYEADGYPGVVELGVMSRQSRSRGALVASEATVREEVAMRLMRKAGVEPNRAWLMRAEEALAKADWQPFALEVEDGLAQAQAWTYEGYGAVLLLLAASQAVFILMPPGVAAQELRLVQLGEAAEQR